MNESYFKKYKLKTQDKNSRFQQSQKRSLPKTRPKKKPALSTTSLFFPYDVTNNISSLLVTTKRQALFRPYPQECNQSICSSQELFHFVIAEEIVT